MSMNNNLLEWTFNDSNLGIVVRADSGSTSLQIRVGKAHTSDPIPMLRRAIAAIEAEIADYSRCPIHSRTEATAPPPPEKQSLPERAA
jgi:hypothetical protein